MIFYSYGATFIHIVSFDTPISPMKYTSYYALFYKKKGGGIQVFTGFWLIHCCKAGNYQKRATPLRFLSEPMLPLLLLQIPSMCSIILWKELHMIFLR